MLFGEDFSRAWKTEQNVQLAEIDKARCVIAQLEQEQVTWTAVLQQQHDNIQVCAAAIDQRNCYIASEQHISHKYQQTLNRIGHYLVLNSSSHDNDDKKDDGLDAVLQKYGSVLCCSCPHNKMGDWK